jgi:hypothetical protein
MFGPTGFGGKRVSSLRTGSNAGQFTMDEYDSIRQLWVPPPEFPSRDWQFPSLTCRLPSTVGTEPSPRIQIFRSRGDDDPAPTTSVRHGGWAGECILLFLPHPSMDLLQTWWVPSSIMSVPSYVIRLHNVFVFPLLFRLYYDVWLLGKCALCHCRAGSSLSLLLLWI